VTPMTSPTRVVALACLAPSVHNTQPWWWRVEDRTIELYADRGRRLRFADPQGRNLAISCGAALHHAQVAARALGWRPHVARLPQGRDSNLLARIMLEPDLPRPAAVRDLETLKERCTDRRSFTSWPVPAELVSGLASVAAASGALARAVTDVGDRIEVELLVSRALDLQLHDPSLAAEQRQWIRHGVADGIPADAVPAGTAPTRGRRSRFVDQRLDDTDRQRVEGSDGILVLGGRCDDVTAWLTTGEALSALWLQATRDGVSVVPLSQVVEVDETRCGLQHGVLGGSMYPHLLVRLGWQPLGRRTQTRTPRRALEAVLAPLLTLNEPLSKRNGHHTDEHSRMRT
jgi:hypothetical protein